MKLKLITWTTAAVMAAAPAFAAEYPVKTVRLITHSSVGGGTDVFLRELAKYLAPELGVNIIVDNVVGGGGAKAIAEVAKEPADGSTFYGTTPSYIITSLLSQPAVTYEDLTPVVNLFNDPQTLYVRADSPYNSLQDFVEDAQANPGQRIVAVSTPSSLDRMVVERMKSVTNTDFVTLTHDGGGDVMLSVLNGTAHLGVGEIAELRGQVEAGALRLLATYTDERVAVLDGVPTAKESGYDLVVSKFRGIAGRPDLPEEVFAAWEEAIAKITQNPDFKAWYEKEGVQLLFLNHEEAVAHREGVVKEIQSFFKEYNIN